MNSLLINFIQIFIQTMFPYNPPKWHSFMLRFLISSPIPINSSIEIMKHSAYLHPDHIIHLSQFPWLNHPYKNGQTWSHSLRSFLHFLPISHVFSTTAIQNLTLFTRTIILFPQENNISFNTLAFVSTLPLLLKKYFLETPVLQSFIVSTVFLWQCEVFLKSELLLFFLI